MAGKEDEQGLVGDWQCSRGIKGRRWRRRLTRQLLSTGLAHRIKVSSSIMVERFPVSEEAIFRTDPRPVWTAVWQESLAVSIASLLPSFRKNS
ncbi:hypothetical protein MRX96_027875 [Rhipicephalus microplus]